jgi:hypothetical protein
MELGYAEEDKRLQDAAAYPLLSLGMALWNGLIDRRTDRSGRLIVPMAVGGI